jgi:hypothetical protein
MDLSNYCYWILDIDITDIQQHGTGYTELKLGRRVSDRFEIEDLVKYCGISYSMVRGYVFSGPTINVSQFIEDLAAKKQAAEPGSDERNAYKRALNSIYGKLLFKGYKTEKHRYFDSPQEFEKYVARHWSRVEKYDARKREIWLDQCLNLGFNFAQIGVMVLSMSKRVMNELFEECAGLGIPILLSHTDSILIPTDKVELLGNRIGPDAILVSCMLRPVARKQS